jgi:hypothetical protein
MGGKGPKARGKKEREKKKGKGERKDASFRIPSEEENIFG